MLHINPSVKKIIVLASTISAFCKIFPYVLYVTSLFPIKAISPKQIDEFYLIYYSNVSVL